MKLVLTLDENGDVLVDGGDVPISYDTAVMMLEVAKLKIVSWYSKEVAERTESSKDGSDEV